MRADVNHDKKLILVWKTTDEADLPVSEEIEREIAPFRAEKYKLIIMKSGDEDLYELTLFLLKTNRMKMVRREIEAERAAGDTPEPAFRPSSSVFFLPKLGEEKPRVYQLHNMQYLNFAPKFLLGAIFPQARIADFIVILTNPPKCAKIRMYLLLGGFL